MLRKAGKNKRNLLKKKKKKKKKSHRYCLRNPPTAAGPPKREEEGCNLLSLSAPQGLIKGLHNEVDYRCLLGAYAQNG